MFLLLCYMIRHHTPDNSPWTGPNQILEVIFYIVLNKNWKITGANKVLLVLGWRIGAHCVNWDNGENKKI
jgi:hypothetical protein